MPTLAQINQQIADLEAQRATLLANYSRVVQIGQTGFSISLELKTNSIGKLEPNVLLLKNSQAVPGVLELPAAVLQACLTARKKLDNWIAGTANDITL